MKKILLVSIAFFAMQLAFSQSIQQLASTDLELQFSETMIKHGSDWYFGTGGGVFKSSNNGSNWTLVNTDLFTSLGELRVDGFLSTSSRLLVYNRWRGFVATTEGSQWVSSNSGLPNNREMTSNPVKIGSRILVAINDHDLSENAIYYSDNDGAQWNKGATLANYFELVGAVDTAMISVDGEIHNKTVNGIDILSTTFTSNFPGSKIDVIRSAKDSLIVFGESEIYRYNRLNGNWKNIGDNIPGGIGFLSGMVSDNGNIYASVLGGAGLKLFISKDLGENWVDKVPTLPRGVAFAIGGFATGDELMCCFIDAGMYYSSDAGDNFVSAKSGALASNFNEIVASGNSLLTSLFISGVYKSTDLGITWNISNTGIVDELLKRLYGFEVVGSNLYANFSTNPDDNPSPEDVYISPDNGSNWSKLSVPAGRTTIQLGGVSGNTLFFISGGSDSTYYRLENGSTTYTNLTSTMPANHNPIFISGDGTTTFLAAINQNKTIDIYTSDNKGDSWQLSMDGINTGDLQEFNPNNDNFLMTIGPSKAFYVVYYNNWNRKLLRWTGSAWTEATASGMPYVDFSMMVIHDGTLLTSNWNGNLMASFNEGENFKIVSGLPNGLNINDVAFLGEDMFITTERGIWKGTVPVNGINPINSEPFMLVNPVKNSLILSEFVNQIKISNLKGQVMLQADSPTKSVNVNALTNGVYLVEIKKGISISKFKIMILNE